MTDTKPTVVEALAAVADDVRAIRKEQRNQHSGYNFRGIDAVMNAVGPALRRHGVVCLPAETLDLHQETVQTTSGKPTMASKVHVRYRFHGPAGDYLDADVWGESWDSSDKGLAQAYSVAYRTMLLQALTIPTDAPDPDEHTYERAPQPPPAPEIPPEQRATREQVDILTAELAALDPAGLDAYGDWRIKHNIPSLKRPITLDQADAVAGWLEERKASAPFTEGEQ